MFEEAVLMTHDHREGDAGGGPHVARPKPVMHAPFTVAGDIPTRGRQRDEIDAIFAVFIDGDATVVGAVGRQVGQCVWRGVGNDDIIVLNLATVYDERHAKAGAGTSAFVGTVAI